MVKGFLVNVFLNVQLERYHENLIPSTVRVSFCVAAVLPRCRFQVSAPIVGLNGYPFAPQISSPVFCYRHRRISPKYLRP